MDNATALSMAAFWGNIHLLRVMVNRGAISPNEVDEIYGSIVEALQGGDAEFAAGMEARLEGVFAEMRQWAEKLWKGSGNPR